MSKAVYGIGAVLMVSVGLAMAVGAHPVDDGSEVPQASGENGYGPDPDRDDNPATNTRLMARIGAAAEATLQPPYRTITFEAPLSRHGEAVGKQYAKEFGVTFGPGLTRQLCVGQRYFQYDSACTYRRAPSGRFAALYRDDWGRPLKIRFAAPVCALVLAIYPTGGEEGEKFEAIIQPYGPDEEKLDKAVAPFTWTSETFRWRLMVGVYLLDRRATRIEASVVSKDNTEKNVRFLIDDVAFVKEGCDEFLAEIRNAAGAPSIVLNGLVSD
ncbi:hypothetical protein [Amphiplicatus metriothermophilus]|uniref:Methanolan biosynthesis EpsI domain-containing protein n=1 Tax=Amphiplicatus metriothermophilus TaxID=1519374 RepID=A0A239PZN9_9PROT|nr:hypothetical protein [Amphiplicatus metriothermophilus]MBB5519819.1 hypothetical protein [Amphiplicatus metriothermophilus]SNT75137.1 hypothetical protein SAMN06297382_2573 [Amphiplicatus metriothermophilus]